MEFKLTGTGVPLLLVGGIGAMGIGLLVQEKRRLTKKEEDLVQLLQEVKDEISELVHFL